MQVFKQSITKVLPNRREEWIGLFCRLKENWKPVKMVLIFLIAVAFLMSASLGVRAQPQQNDAGTGGDAVAGSGWSVEVVDSFDWTEGEGYPSIAVDSSGNPHISYTVGSYLKYASWNGTSWDIQTVKFSYQLSSTSIVLDSHDSPHICSGHLYAVWNGSSWDIKGVDKIYEMPSMALDSKNRPHVVGYCVNEDISGWDSPPSFTLAPNESVTLTATLTSNGNLLPGKTVTWSATDGAINPSSGTTDSQGKVTVTYTAPSGEESVIVTASFAGDPQRESSDSAIDGLISAKTTSEGSTRPSSWWPWLLLLVFLILVIGLTAYLKRKRRKPRQGRKTKSGKLSCSKCGAEIPGNSAFCPFCGAKLRGRRGG